MSSLDLPYPGKDTEVGVASMPDDYTVTGPIRIAQHLSNVWHVVNPKELTPDGRSWRLRGRNIFPPLMQLHPLTLWAQESDANYSWLYFFACDLCDEYLKRFGDKAQQPVQHGIRTMLRSLEEVPPALPEGEWTEPPMEKLE